MNQKELKFELETLETELKKLNQKKLDLQQLLFYQDYYRQGYDKQMIEDFITEDSETLVEAETFKSNFNALRNHFFGYPGNLTDDSPLVRQLRYLEAELYYVNNAGDPFENSYGSLDGKIYERKVLELFFKRFDLNPDTSWGYITTGGSESNLWGILNGFRKYPKGRFYFCEAAHYSVEKAVMNGDNPVFPFTKISTTSKNTDAINVTELIKSIKDNFIQNNEIPILLLTWGSTKFGSIDDIKVITQKLLDLNIEYYLHVDAAFYGGIPRNQIDAPVCPSLKELNAHSLSISFHKFFGVPDINSVLLSYEKPSGLNIAYLRQHDTTLSGSRTFSIFSAYQRIKEVLERSPVDLYRKNILAFETLVKDYPVEYHRDGLSSMIIIPLPSLELLDKYQLAAFEGSGGEISLAHFILNPFHQYLELETLMKELYDDQIVNNRHLFL